MHSFFFFGQLPFLLLGPQPKLLIFLLQVDLLPTEIDLNHVDNWIVESVVKKLKQEFSPCCSSSHSTFIKCFFPFEIACITWYLQCPQRSFDKLKSSASQDNMPACFSGYCSQIIHFQDIVQLTCSILKKITFFACLITMLSPQNLIDFGRSGLRTCLLEYTTLPVFRIILSLV